MAARVSSVRNDECVIEKDPEICGNRLLVPRYKRAVARHESLDGLLVLVFNVVLELFAMNFCIPLEEVLQKYQ
jgi:hypothetical protein